MRETLNNLASQKNDSIDALGEADTALGIAIANAINDFLKKNNIDKDSVIAIGSHGQTVRHRPGTEPSKAFTMQIGDPNIIAELTGITVIADFRRRDMAAGGEAAPLVPGFHALLYRCSEENRVILNIGGISNITLLSQDATQTISGFDTGPGNGLMDAWINKHQGLPYDKNGDWAASGKVSPALLDMLMQDDYLNSPPPKSTGREHYSLSWLEHLLISINSSLSAVDIQATLADFTAKSIALAISTWAYPNGKVIVCGGGRLNALLMQRLQTHIDNYQVLACDSFGTDGDQIEAAAFAWLAHLRLQSIAGNTPAVTGARGPRVLGAIYPGATSHSNATY